MSLSRETLIFALAVLVGSVTVESAECRPEGVAGSSPQSTSAWPDGLTSAARAAVQADQRAI
ncbi:MAG TPA: hypothetical protein VNT79_13150, partial [Phycisphaerae bacterium]|nr:hypothetical protein [Phycisphaerae bacterium]